jgi:carbamoyltransferase
MPLNILGIWDGHDAGAAFLVGGRLVAAVNEERLTRRKLEVRFPKSSIAACLAIAGVDAGAIDIVAASTSDLAKTLTRLLPSAKERYYRVRRRKAEPGISALATRRLKQRLTRYGPTFVSTAISRRAIAADLRRAGIPTRRIEIFDHHTCHAWCAVSVTGAPSSAIITIDGLGDGLSATTSVYRNDCLTRLSSSPAVHSLGVFFEHVTMLLNMRELEDEGKVMALADYAAPVPDADNALLGLLRVDEGRIRATETGPALERRLRRIHWKYSNEQFAQMAQRAVELVCTDLARDAVKRSGESTLAVAGGVASNIKATRAMRLLPDVSAVHVFPHMGDGGLALGAAIACARAHEEALAIDLSQLDLGPAYPVEALASALTAKGLSFTKPQCIESAVADLLVRDGIVLWFQGRMEYGPRALGQRSVLARPDRFSLRDRLNRALKRRAWYQPFCPSLLESEAPLLLADWDGPHFAGGYGGAGPTNPHMTMAYMVRPEHRERMAGVIGPDGSCRPQIVPDDASTPFARVLHQMRARLGTGAVLNTSFNVHGEPLVCTPGDAVDVYLRSGADALALGPYLVVR